MTLCKISTEKSGGFEASYSQNKRGLLNIVYLHCIIIKGQQLIKSLSYFNLKHNASPDTADGMGAQTSCKHAHAQSKDSYMTQICQITEVLNFCFNYTYRN